MRQPFTPISGFNGVNPFSSASLPMGSSPGVSLGNIGGIGSNPGFVDETNKGSFKDIMSNLVGQVDQTVQAPDALMHRAMTTGDVDVSDVMIANAKADIAVNMASQVITKVIQAYERVQQIQV